MESFLSWLFGACLGKGNSTSTDDVTEIAPENPPNGGNLDVLERQYWSYEGRAETHIYLSDPLKLFRKWKRDALSTENECNAGHDMNAARRKVCEIYPLEQIVSSEP